MDIRVRVVSGYSNKYYSLIRCGREFWTLIWKLNFGLFKFEFESKTADIQYCSYWIKTLEYMHIIVRVVSFYSNKYYSLIRCGHEFWNPIWKLNFGLSKFEFESKTPNLQYHSNLIMTLEYMHIMFRLISSYSNKYYKLNKMWSWILKPYLKIEFWSFQIWIWIQNC
jgi:hypothetical protein